MTGMLYRRWDLTDSEKSDGDNGYYEPFGGSIFQERGRCRGRLRIHGLQTDGEEGIARRTAADLAVLSFCIPTFGTVHADQAKPIVRLVGWGAHSRVVG